MGRQSRLPRRIEGDIVAIRPDGLLAESMGTTYAIHARTHPAVHAKAKVGDKVLFFPMALSENKAVGLRAVLVPHV